MKRSTTVAIALISLLIGSGASGLLFAMPAHEENGKLTRQKRTTAGEKAGLEKQVAELEAKLNGMAMDSIAYFDLRESANKPREMESKTVDTLASLTEIFNDHHIRVVKLDPKGESTGIRKPSGAAAPEPSPTPTPKPSKKSKKAKGKASDAAPTEPPIKLVHKQFAFQVQGEYLDLVKAVSEIQGLPKAISVNAYDMALLDKSGGLEPKKGQDERLSPTALELNFQLSITFLLAGGPSTDAVSAAPAAQATAPNMIEWLLGQPAEAAEAKARFRFEGVRYADGGLMIETAPGTPHFEVAGLSRKLLVVTLTETSQADAERLFQVGQGGIERVRATRDPKDPTRVRLAIETDGSVRLKPELDGRKRLRLSSAPLEVQPPRELALPAAVATPSAAPSHAPATAPRAPLHLIDGIAHENGEIVVRTHAVRGQGAPSFKLLGGRKHLLILELEHTNVSPASGRLFPIEKDGVIQARAALFKNDPVTTRLVIDTDGTVKLTPRLAGGQLRIAIAPLPGAAKKPPAPAKATPKPAEPAKAAPSEAPKPLATPQAKATPKPAPTPMASPVPVEEGPRLRRSLSSSYAFPIEREHVTGRANPFKVLPNRRKLAEAQPFQPQGVLPPAPPVVDPGGAPTLPALPQAPGTAKAAPAVPAAYELKAVMIGGGAPAVAVIAVSGATHQVGLNGSLPGNARVKVIQPDYVILTSNGVDLRINLKK